MHLWIRGEEYKKRKWVARSLRVPIYVCPDCKSPLVAAECLSCHAKFPFSDGIPVLLSRDPRFQSGAQIGTVYDDIYARRTGVWVDQGRTPEFILYFSGLLAKYSVGRVLEIGCGEGFLLSALRAGEKFAMDLSLEALRKARGRAQAEYCNALAERLPYPSDSFDMVVSVGVMEHFLDDRLATKEVYRVLKPGGRYVVLLHVSLSFPERISQKLHEYFYPRPRPFAFVKWLSSKFIRPIRQPIQRPYTRQSGQACLEDCGFSIEVTISTNSHPNVPLVGPHVLIFIACKR